MLSRDFAWTDAPKEEAEKAAHVREHALSAQVLLRNARWFIQLRWAVVAMLACAQVAAWIAGRALDRVGLSPPGIWPLIIAGVLTLLNLLYAFLAPASSARRAVSPRAHLWLQIVFDLLCLTVVVHFCGSMGTPAPLFYALHIALACVFFGNRESALVTLLAISFYAACLTGEWSGILPRSPMVPAVTESAHRNGGLELLYALLTFASFAALWFVVSRLSAVIRLRERQLLESEESTQAAQHEKDRYALHLAHQLKAPLDAVRSLIALVTGGYAGAAAEAAIETLRKADLRAQGLGEMIKDLLKLAHLRSAPQDASGFSDLDLGVLLARCIENHRATAAKRGITFEVSVAPTVASCRSEHVEALFDNLLSNAVAYSHDGGTVRVACSPANGSLRPVVSVADQGIGIDEEGMECLFDEHYRSPRAAQHNRASSGIGLQIVKHVAQTHGLHLRVASEAGKGSTFTVVFPKR